MTLGAINHEALAQLVRAKATLSPDERSIYHHGLEGGKFANCRTSGWHREETPVSDPVDALVMDLLEWIGPQSRPYAEVIDAWRTSCPRLPVWEEANARGYVIRAHVEGSGVVVSLSPSGRAALDKHLVQGHSIVPALGRQGGHPCKP
jgi:hypothetical protein